MVFTSVPPYLDSPQWHQHPNHQIGSTTASMNENDLDRQQSPPPLPPPQSSTGSIRPNSMTDRARIAKIPQPESALKCPRCESTNTKFCYFNNYSLSQPRHFCKACRRYWTRGGALRSVPVGGGCRRNKRSKRSGSNSSISGAQKGGSNTTSTSTNNTTTTSLPSNLFTSDAITNMVSPLLPQLPYMTSLHQLHEYGDHMGFSFSTIQPPLIQGNNMDFQIGSYSTPTSAIGGSSGGNILSEQWRSQQFPFLSGGPYPFEGDIAAVKSSVPVKMEGTQGLNFSRQFMSTQGNDQYWGGGVGAGTGNNNAWPDLSSFTSSTATHLL